MVLHAARTRRMPHASARSVRSLYLAASSSSVDSARTVRMLPSASVAAALPSPSAAEMCRFSVDDHAAYSCVTYVAGSSVVAAKSVSCEKQDY